MLVSSDRAIWGILSPSPAPKKGRSYVPSRRRAPAHGISPLLFTTQSGRVSRSLLTNVFASSPLSHRVYNNCKLCVGFTVARFGDNVNLDLEWRHLQLNLSLVLIGKPLNHLGTNPFVDRSFCWSLFVDRSLCWSSNTVISSFVSTPNWAVLTLYT